MALMEIDDIKEGEGSNSLENSLLHNALEDLSRGVEDVTSILDYIKTQFVNTFNASMLEDTPIPSSSVLSQCLEDAIDLGDVSYRQACEKLKHTISFKPARLSGRTNDVFIEKDQSGNVVAQLNNFSASKSSNQNRRTAEL